MKKLAIILAFAILPYVSIAQSNFDKYEDMKGVSSVVVTSKMFKLLSQIKLESNDAEVQEYMNLVENIKNIKVFATENAAVGQKMRSDVSNYLKSSSLDELMRVKSDGKNVKFYSKPGKDDDHVSELFMFLDGVKEDGDGPNTVVLTITGDIDLKQVSKIADHLNVPGGEELKHVKKKGN
ncbi:hypothetical protein IWQ47_004778 [Aquimarina sp. EL_43]|uniref:DUF4252 domain-containing protein n=1 Tax=unclassified Aquimarina TaxID=2627091 RepID=UPI0018CBE54A|nr:MULTISPECIES: DUF4252 domain-containing protein [unclassified Aquimarina]MBG6133295.1 hypothetical protein [Aquimarina sp. EL_35]MBG6153526.1 hypothetical protein [Aquimarina sp. EL_32]MBG6171682.1 hypothetical protein [Aquimarina sp. EL_43]